MKKKTLIWIVVTTILLIALLLFGSNAGWFGKKGKFKKVEITKIELLDITETVAATGKIQPEVEVKLSSEVSGEIIELPIKEGQQVEKGDLLVKINPDLVLSRLNQSQAGLQTVKAQLAQAEAALKNAELSYNRNSALYE
ncbi:biotin/lipoyl-binding protein, partial [Ulvibacter sp.]|nr:biotin/lipoyl-binding protein [Ulvibacter sp.]